MSEQQVPGWRADSLVLLGVPLFVSLVAAAALVISTRPNLSALRPSPITDQSSERTEPAPAAPLAEAVAATTRPPAALSDTGPPHEVSRSLPGRPTAATPLGGNGGRSTGMVPDRRAVPRIPSPTPSGGQPTGQARDAQDGPQAPSPSPNGGRPGGDATSAGNLGRAAEDSTAVANLGQAAAEGRPSLSAAVGWRVFVHPSHGYQLEVPSSWQETSETFENQAGMAGSVCTFWDPATGDRLEITVWDRLLVRSRSGWPALVEPAMVSVNGRTPVNAVIAGHPALIAWQPKPSDGAVVYGAFFRHGERYCRLRYVASGGQRNMGAFYRALATIRWGDASGVTMVPPLPTPSTPAGG